MSTHKHIDKICCVVLVFTLLLSVLFVNAEKLGIKKASSAIGYEKTLFDTSKVHTIDIIMDDWDEFTANATSEEYYTCSVVIDNEAFKNVAIRGKGNTSLSSVTNGRYSYKIEFDHYDSSNTYYGLDKLCLNNIIQDNTYMKDYLTYTMMRDMGVAAPLCSYVYITVNGEDWGLYLAVEGIEESFLQRNYGKDYGELYKPDSMDMGGGRGNGNDFDINDFTEDFNPSGGRPETNTDTEPTTEVPATQPSDENDAETPSMQPSDESTTQLPEESTEEQTDQTTSFDYSDIPQGMTPPDFSGDFPEGMTPPDFSGDFPEGMTPPDFSGDFPEGMIPSDFSGDFPQGMIPSDFSGDFPQGVIPSDFDVNNFFGIGKSESSSSATSSISKMLSSDTAIASSEDAEINSATPSDSDNSNPFNGSIPEGFTPPTGENGEFEIPSDFSDIFNGGFGGGFGGMNSSDVKLQYIDDNVNSYSNIFENAKTDITTADKNRLIDSLKNLGNGENLEAAVDIDAVIRYFVVHNFVVNSDSYTGSMIHNYYLYEKDGQMQMIPWDYNLAFGSFMSMGSATSSVNDPIDTPLSVSGSGDRPMIDWIFSNEEYTELYHQYFNEFIELYFGNGYFEEMINNVKTMISPYVEKDPTKFCTYEEFEAGVSTLESFCLLRAESVKGQLNGTIGTTTDTQKSETLIDASDIDVSSMGTMGSMGGMGSGMSFPGDNMQIPTVDPADGTANTPPTENDNGNASEQQMPDFFSGDFNGMTPPQGENASTEIDRSKIQPQNTLPLSSLIMIGVSVIVLALGTLIAFKYKRRKR